MWSYCVPKMLTEVEKTNVATSNFLKRYSNESYEFLNRIVIEDVSWVAHFALKPKQQYMKWRMKVFNIPEGSKNPSNISSLKHDVYYAIKGFKISVKEFHWVGNQTAKFDESNIEEKVYQIRKDSNPPVNKFYFLSFFV